MKKTGYIDGRRIAGFTLGGASAINGLALTISDIATPSSGYMRGLYINYTQSGAKTGTAEVNPLAVDMNIAANVPHAFAVSLYACVTGSPTIDYFSGIYLYFDATGTATVNRKYGIQLEIDNTNAPTESGFLYLYRHGTTNQVTSIIRLERAAGTATYFVNGPAAEPVSAGSDSTDVSFRVAWRVGTLTKYLHLFDS